MWARVPGAVALLLVLAGEVRAQGTLDDVREEVREDDDPAHEGDGYDDDRDLHEDLEDELLDSFFGGGLEVLLENTLLLPWRAPRLFLGDTDFAPAGFADDPRRAGAYWLEAEDGALDGRRLALRPRLELGTDFDDLERTAVGLELEHASRFGLDFEWARWREELASGGTDELDLGSLDLVYRFAQSAQVAFVSGVGLNVLDDASDTDYGFNTTYGATFLTRPFVLTFEADLGTLGEATVTHLGASLGCRLGRVELFAGWDRREIGSAELPSYSLGLRGWF